MFGSRILRPLVRLSASTASSRSIVSRITGSEWFRVSSRLAAIGGAAAAAGAAYSYHFSKEVPSASVTRQTDSPQSEPTSSSHKGTLLEKFEEFNDWSRVRFGEFLDRFYPLPPAPWLIDLETIQYPSYVPTLVVDMDKVLCKLEYDRKHGWRVIKRPGADRFIKELQHYYELVVFSDDQFPVAQETANVWNMPCTGVLHRDFCKRRNNKYIKDVSKLGRKLEKVIVLDHDPAAFSLQPDNGILISEFQGNEDDHELIDLIDFLRAAALSQEDTRQFIKKNGGGDVDVGRRYLLKLKEQQKQVNSRRTFARSLGMPVQGGSVPTRAPGAGAKS